MLRGIVVIALTVGCPALLSAQATTQSSTTAAGVTTAEPESHWLASGFAGSNFAMSASPGSGSFGGSVGYLWKGKVGAEVATGFTPNFQHQSAFFGLGITPQVNDYMGNVIGALPLGADAAWEPYLSGGLGTISLGTTLSNTAGNAVKLDASRLGGDVGAGIMGFRGNWGFKADVRYFRTTGAYNSPGIVTTSASPGSSPVVTTPITGPAPAPSPAPAPAPSPGPAPAPTPVPAPAPGPYASARMATGVISTGTDTSALGNNLLAGLAFWRANIGLAFRW